MTTSLEETVFFAKDLIDALEAEGVTAVVFQSGGNCATIEIRQEPHHEAFLVGPGSYNWNNPSQSIFTTDELSYGEDVYDVDGEMKEADPVETIVEPNTPLPQVAKEIAEAYRLRNTF